MKADMVNGSVIGNYRVLQKLGETAEYITYSGKTLDTNQDVILKAMRQPPALIRLALPDFQGRTTRFTQLQHESLCKVFEIVRDDQAFYVVCEAPQCQLLSTALANKGKFALSVVIPIIDQVLELLVYLHQQKVTHCDLRPTNIYLDDNNRIQLADAGLIQLLSLENQTTAPESISALEFTAPERILYSKILGTKVDARADLYAVGVLFYLLLTGQPPLTAESREQMIRAQIERIPTPVHTLTADISAPVEQIIFRALEKSPERRFAAAETMRTALQRAQAPEAGLAPLEPSLAYLMESLQMADAQPSANLTNAPTMSAGAPVKNTASPESLLASVQASLAASAAAASAGTTGSLNPKITELFDTPTMAPPAMAAASGAPAPPTQNQQDNDHEADALHELFPAEQPDIVTLSNAYGNEAEAPVTVEIEITPESVSFTQDQDDHAFDELRARVNPAQWPRKALLAACALTAMLFVGCSVYWMARPSNKIAGNIAGNIAGTAPDKVINPPVVQSTAAVTQQAMASPLPAASLAPATLPATPKPVLSPTATPAQLRAVVEPTAPPTIASKVMPAPARPVATPAPVVVAKVEPTPVRMAKIEKVRVARSYKPSILIEKERRKRAILNSLSQ